VSNTFTVADEAMVLSAERPATALSLLPVTTLSLLAAGYSLIGTDPGPKGFPEISLEEEP